MLEGDKVKDSPIGSGIITGFTERGFPVVNHIAVSWLELESGRVFNPWDAKGWLSSEKELVVK